MCVCVDQVKKLEQQLEELQADLQVTRTELSSTRRQFNQNDQGEIRGGKAESANGHQSKLSFIEGF